MSRIGKKPIEIPDGVDINIRGAEVTIKGKLGTLKEVFPETLEIVKDGKTLLVKTKGGERDVKALHGLVRNLLANMVNGVSKGYERKLNFVGVGYKADVQGKNVNLALGYSHPVSFPLPEGITAAVDKNSNALILKGADKKLIGEVAASIRRVRPPEPYKGKGVMYEGEVIERKVGKTGAK